jgi:chromosome partitioning protein
VFYIKQEKGIAVNKKHVKKGIVIAVLNMKGGVGKTTVAAHVFRRLYWQLSKSVLLIDFDPQFNLTQTVTTQVTYESLKAQQKTVLSIMEAKPTSSIFNVSEVDGPLPSVEEIGVVLRQYTNTPSINLTLIPGDFDLHKYSLIQDESLLNRASQRFANFVNKARETRDIVCIDCNPSSSFMTLCALKVATHILVPVRPDRYSILGLKLLNQFISGVPQINPKPKVVILINGVKTRGYDTSVEDELRSDPKLGPLTLATTLGISRLLEASIGYTGFATDRKHSWRVTPRISKIVDEIGIATGLVK